MTKKKINDSSCLSRPVALPSASVCLALGLNKTTKQKNLWCFSAHSKLRPRKGFPRFAPFAWSLRCHWILGKHVSAPWINEGGCVFWSNRNGSNAVEDLLPLGKLVQSLVRFAPSNWQTQHLAKVGGWWDDSLTSDDTALPALPPKKTWGPSKYADIGDRPIPLAGTMTPLLQVYQSHCMIKLHSATSYLGSQDVTHFLEFEGFTAWHQTPLK